MTTRRCARCDWRSVHNVDSEEADLSPATQLALHAIESGHPLCIVCYRSLADHERQVCEQCVAKAQSNLSGIRTLYDWLPTHLRTMSSDAYGHGSGDGRPVLGGDALVLLGPGSEGLDEDGKTSKDGDPVSIAFELQWWETDWRETRDEAYDDDTPRSTPRVLRDAVGYLERHTRWAATSHPGFDQYARDLKALHVRLQVATGQVRLPTQLDGRCTQCGADSLIRKIARSGLEEEVATCCSCGARFDGRAFLDLLKKTYAETSLFTDTEGTKWARLETLVAMLDRKANTIKRWRTDGLVRVLVVDHVQFLHVDDVKAEDATRPKRKRAS